MIYNPCVEQMSRDGMAALQWQRFSQSLTHIYQNVAPFAEKMKAAGVCPGDIRSLSDIAALPFTYKDEMRQHYPYGLFAVPMSQIVRLHASSGTTGQPTVVGYTKNDIELWAECIARLAVAGGVTRDDICQISFGYGLFTGAFGLHQGLEKLGATVLPISAGNTERQIRLMADFGSTVLIGTPSYALYIQETAEKMGLLDQISLKYGLFGGEGSTEAMRKQIEDKFHITATENYGLSEIIGPGVSGECLCKCGMHINEDYFYCEIIDPETEKPLPDGSWGELVITTLAREGSPMVRYRTRDITSITRQPCACGRTTARMAKIRGRSDDMLIIRGVNVFPSQIESVLLATPAIGAHYEIIVRRENHLDNLEIRVELADSSLLDHYSKLEHLAADIRARLKSTVLCDAKVTLVEPSTLKRFEGKAKRVVDLRT